MSQTSADILSTVSSVYHIDGAGASWAGIFSWKETVGARAGANFLTNRRPAPTLLKLANN
jgi:hypothetical protein